MSPTTTAPQSPDTASVEAVASRFNAIVDNVEKAIQGKAEAIELAVICLLAEGHILLEDVPGVGKTTLAKSLARSVDCLWHRIQFTPDLLPSDVTGLTIYNRSTEKFEFRPGGIFANIVLGDEINRASPKTQSAMLEAMEERQVTIDSRSYSLRSPFMVIATQNPVEHEGTYPLPESQLDRFLMRLSMGYPDPQSELEMLQARQGGIEPQVGSVVTASDIVNMTEIAKRVHVAPSLMSYIVEIAEATRRHPALALGLSPRGSLALLRSARARAASMARTYVIPDDIKALARPVAEHRLIMHPTAQNTLGNQSEILGEILHSVPVPTRG